MSWERRLTCHSVWAFFLSLFTPNWNRRVGCGLFLVEPLFQALSQITLGVKDVIFVISQNCTSNSCRMWCDCQKYPENLFSVSINLNMRLAVYNFYYFLLFPCTALLYPSEFKMFYEALHSENGYLKNVWHFEKYTYWFSCQKLKERIFSEGHYSAHYPT